MKNKRLNWGWVIGLAAYALFSSFVVYAGGVTPVGGSTYIKNPIGADSFSEFLVLVLDIIVTIGTPIVIIAILLVGFKFITAQGKPAELEKAKSAFLWVMVGTMIVIGARVIAEIVENTVNAIK